MADTMECTLHFLLTRPEQLHTNPEPTGVVCFSAFWNSSWLFSLQTDFHPGKNHFKISKIISEISLSL